MTIRTWCVLFSVGLMGAGVCTAATAQSSGRDIAANCANCHGTDGRSRSIVPSLAGRDKATIAAQVKAFRDGTRPSTVMQQLAKGYTDAQIDAASAYLSAQKATTP